MVSFVLDCIFLILLIFPFSHEVLLFEALREALIEEMKLDPTVCVFGEDVGHYGGSYKVTKGLADMFGDLESWIPLLLRTHLLAWGLERE